MSWRVLMNAENEHFRSQEQKEQKGEVREAFATIADRNPKVKNTLKGRVASESVEWVKAKKRQPIFALNDRQEQGNGDTENVDPRPDMRTVKVFSKVLNREVFVSWEGDNPGTIFFDGIPYSVAEIAKLKEMPLNPDDLRAIQQVKEPFEVAIA